MYSVLFRTKFVLNFYVGISILLMKQLGIIKASWYMGEPLQEWKYLKFIYIYVSGFNLSVDITRGEKGSHFLFLFSYSISCVNAVE